MKGRGELRILAISRIVFLLLFPHVALAQDTAKSSDLKESYITNLLDTPNVWIVVKRDTIGYLIYTPCEGDVSKIIIHDNHLIVHWGFIGDDSLMIPDDSFTITKITKTDTAAKQTINAENPDEWITLTAQVVGKHKMLVVWEMGVSSKSAFSLFNVQFTTTSQQFISQFRMVYCDNKGQENEFLPDEF